MQQLKKNLEKKPATKTRESPIIDVEVYFKEYGSRGRTHINTNFKYIVTYNLEVW